MQTISAAARRPLARPERWGIALSDPAGATRLELPSRGAGAAALIVAAMLVVFAGVLVFVIRTVDWHATRDVGSLMTTLFRLFWILGWSVGVLVLGGLTVLLCFYRPGTWLAADKLVDAPRIGPLRMIAEYDLARMRNVRVESAGGESVRVRFDYGEGTRTLGDAMPSADAARVVATLRAALPAATAATPSVPASREAAPAEEAPQPLSPASVIALVLANLIPLLGVLMGGWRLDQVMLLFWAESGVIAFYTVLKMAVVGKWLAVLAGPFFVAHFGAFMAIHFLFIYELFVRGPRPWGPEPGAYEALSGVFAPLWPALLALFLSHGLSFGMNFLGRRESRSASLSNLMNAPYKRVVLMHVTIILGGWLVLLLKTPTPALALLVLLKIAADLRAHRGERKISSR